MKIRVSKVLAIVFGLVCLVLLASACGGSADDGSTATGEVPQDTSNPAGEAPSDPAGEAPSDTSDPEADTATEATAETADPNPTIPAPGEYNIEENAASYVRALFNLDPSPEAVDCLVAEAEARPVFERALAANTPVFNTFDDDTLYAVNTSINGCVEALGLGGWATLAVGPTGETAEMAPGCFADYFMQPDTGDDMFHTFVALSFQHRYDPELVPAMVDIFASCTPVTGLQDFFINEAEAAASFEVQIDRDCFGAAIEDRQVSVDFWTTLIEAQVPASTVTDPYLEQCAQEIDSDLADQVPADFVAWSGSGDLATVKPSARAGIYSEAPPMSIDAAGTYTAVLTTGGGEVVIDLFADSAPMTVNNFVNLANDGYYDGVTFHRVIEGFMAQGGDPTGTGSGGPGYSFGDETGGGPSFDRPGLLAMANSGPSTNGSQFFITFVPTEHLNGAHTIFGEVTEGMDIVNAIARTDASAGRGQVIDSVTITSNAG